MAKVLDGILIGLTLVLATSVGQSALKTAQDHLRQEEARLRSITEQIRTLGDPQSALATLDADVKAAILRLTARVSVTESLDAVSNQIRGRAMVAAVNWSPDAIRVELIASGPMDPPRPFGTYVEASSRPGSDMPDGRRRTEWIFKAVPEDPSR